MKSKIATVGAPLAVVALIVALVSVAIFQTKAQEQDHAVAVTVPVELRAGGSVKGGSIGLLITVGNENAEGSEWNQAAAGAQVAVERFNRAGADLTLVTEDDRGTASGALAAVRSMADQNVSGIIVATRGEHLKAAIYLAQQLDIPLIFPYDSPNAEGTWSFQADDQSMKNLMVVHNAGQRLIRLDQENFGGVEYAADQVVNVTADTDTEQLARDLSQQVKDSKVPVAIAINADPYLQARIVRSLQDLGVDAELILAPGATSPAFGASYLSGDVKRSTINAVSIGYNSGDAVALQSDGEGRSMSAYLQMVKIMSDSSNATSPLGDQPFSAVAGAADSRSHDSLVAFVRAMERSPSHKAKDVKETLRGLKLSPADGITSGSVDFSSQHVVQAKPILLAASIGNLDMRGSLPSATVGVQWFPQA